MIMLLNLNLGCKLVCPHNDAISYVLHIMNSEFLLTAEELLEIYS